MADTKKPAAKGVPTTDTPGATFPGNSSSLVIRTPEPTPRERVTGAIRGKPADALVEVRAGDVVALAGAIPDQDHTLVTSALRDGAAQHVRDSRTPDTQTVYQTAWQLEHLLESARGEPVQQGA